VRVRGSAVGLCLLVAAATGCTGTKADSSPAQNDKKSGDIELSDAALKAAGLTVGTPRKAPRRTSVTAAGIVDFVPSRVARVGPLVEGRLVEVKVAPGEEVKAGTVLAQVQSVEAGKTRAELASAKVRLHQAETELARQQTLMKDNLTTGAALLAAQTEYGLASVAVSSAAEQLSAIGAGGSPTVTLKTPLGGSVLTLNARIGQTVSITDTLFVVGKIDELWLNVDVYERDLAKVHIGDEARVTVLAYPKDTFVGKIDYVDAVVDPVRRAVNARIVLPNPTGTLRPGMTASARLLSQDTKDAPIAIFVPRGAIQAIDGLPFVFIVKGHEGGKTQYELRPIEKGVEVEGEVEVVRGLEGAETLVTEGTFILKSEYLREQMGKND